jgi:cytochrome oxidase Cu insertion factor (SCO1/SenC/PrrC family)
MRAGWFLIGLVMWGAVFVALFKMWSGRTADTVPGSDDAVAHAEPAADASTAEAAAEDGGDDADLDAAFDELYDENGRPRPKEIKLTWPAAGIADFAFTDRSGETITKNDLLGKPWVTGFVFTACAGPCPRVSLAMQTIQKRYDDQPVNLVTFTVDPKRDTPEVLAKYADFYEADPEQWFFLTGDRDELYGLINGSFLMPVKEDENPEPGFEIIHTTNLCLVDATGRVVGKYNSVKDADMALLRRDLDRLLELQPAGEVTDGSAEAQTSDSAATEGAQ